MRFKRTELHQQSWLKDLRFVRTMLFVIQPAVPAVDLAFPDWGWEVRESGRRSGRTIPSSRRSRERIRSCAISLSLHSCSSLPSALQHCRLSQQTRWRET